MTDAEKLAAEVMLVVQKYLKPETKGMVANVLTGISAGVMQTARPELPSMAPTFNIVSPMVN